MARKPTFRESSRYSSSSEFLPPKSDLLFLDKVILIENVELGFT